MAIWRHAHEELQRLIGRQARTAPLVTGRTLARTVLADWPLRREPMLQAGKFCIRTRDLAESVAMREGSDSTMVPGP